MLCTCLSFLVVCWVCCCGLFELVRTLYTYFKCIYIDNSYKICTCFLCTLYTCFKCSLMLKYIVHSLEISAEICYTFKAEKEDCITK